MKRRNFFKTAFAILGAGAIAPAAKALDQPQIIDVKPISRRLHPGTNASIHRPIGDSDFHKWCQAVHDRLAKIESSTVCVNGEIKKLKDFIEP